MLRFIFLILFMFSESSFAVLRQVDADKLKRVSGSNALLDLPSVSGTLVSDNAIQTLTNKTLTSPIVSGATITGGVVSGAVISGNYSTGDILFASGTTITSLPISVDGKVLTASAGAPVWADSTGGGSGGGGGDAGVNLISNNSFELDVTTGWTTSGVTVARTAFTNGTSTDQYYASMTATVSGAYFETSSITIPDNMRGSDIEFGGYHVNALGAWRADYFVSGTIVASQTLASATTWVQSPTVFAGVASNQTTTKVRYTSLTSGTATLGLNKVYDGSVKSMRTGAIVGPWQNATVTGTWVTNTTYTAKKRQVGNNYEYEVRVATSGAPTATTLSITLPAGDVIDTANMVATQDINLSGGSWVVDSGSGYYPSVINVLNTTTVIPYLQNAAGTYTTISVVNNTTPITFGAGDIITLKFSVPIVGLQASGVSFDGRCQTDIQCTNEFSAKSASTVTTNENLDWINGNPVVTATSTYTFTFNSGVFTSAPNCTAIAENGTNLIVNVISTSTSTVVVRGFNPSSNANATLDFYIRCSRSTDFVAKKTITGYLSQYDVKIANASGDPASATPGNPFIFPTAKFNPDGSYNASTGRFTVNKAGYYKVYGVLNGTPVGGVTIYLYVNGSNYMEAGAANTSVISAAFSGATYANAGDILDIRPNNTFDAGGGNITFERVTGN